LQIINANLKKRQKWLAPICLFFYNVAMRVRKKKYKDAELNDNEKVFLNPERCKGAWSEIFGNENPLCLEIGAGKGKFIRELSGATPEANFIALEREPNVLCMATKAARDGFSNLRFISGDAKNLEDFFAPGELRRIYINFCDPWENKKKWAKRRLTHVSFLNIYKKLLAERGAVYFKTDSKLLFDFSLEQFSLTDFVLTEICRDIRGRAGNIKTEYEEKFESRKEILYCSAVAAI
jgi:tRNA (guanine-N7-)-methyltransferase